MDWKQEFEKKLVSVEEVAAQIQTGDVIFTSATISAPTCVIDAVVERVRAGLVEDIHFVGNQMLTRGKIVDAVDLVGKISYDTLFYDAFDRIGYKNHTVNVNSVHYGQVSRCLKQVYKPNVLLVEMCEPDEEGYVYFGASGGGFACSIVNDVEKILVVINKYQHRAHSTAIPGIHISRIAALCRNDHPMPVYQQPEVTELDLQVASHIVDLIPDGATIQIGRGGLANAIGYGLEKKKNLHVHSEILTDSLVDLAKMGVVTGVMRTGAAFGSQAVTDFCATDRVDIMPYEYINDPNVIGSYENFISINSCMMVDLTGQICSEAIGPRQYSSTGGQLDYVKGAALSKGGKSFLCLRSTHTDKATGKVSSNILATLPLGAVVTTPRSEVMYVVTEYGAVNLYLRPIEERIRLLISIAHPDFREELKREAIQAGVLRADP